MQKITEYFIPKLITIIWRASETLTGVTQLKIGDVYLYTFGRTYVILYFDPRVFDLVMWSTPSQIALNRILWFINTRITLEIELFTILNSFAGAVKTCKLKGLPFLFELVAVVSQCALCHGYKPCATVFT